MSVVQMRLLSVCRYAGNTSSTIPKGEVLFAEQVLRNSTTIAMPTQ